MRPRNHTRGNLPIDKTPNETGSAETSRKVTRQPTLLGSWLRLPITRVDRTVDPDACVHCGGVWWEDAEEGGRCINCGVAHPNMRHPDEVDAYSSAVLHGASHDPVHAFADPRRSWWRWWA